jgi:uncharacterized membrane protein YhaH (DUF805 family)
MQTKNIFEHFWSCVSKDYVNFKGRARRMEYWGYVVVSILASIVVGIFDTMLHLLGLPLPPYFSLRWVLYLILFMPGLAVSARRFQDTGRSGTIPIVVGIINIFLIVFTIAFSIYMMSNLDKSQFQFFDDYDMENLIPYFIFIVLLFLGFGIYMLVVHFLDGTHGPNKYGSDPKHPELGTELDQIGTG